MEIDDTKSLVNVQREFLYDEFYANDIAGFNPTWADALPSSFVLNGKPAYDGRCKLACNPLITRRRIYAYVWGRILADPVTAFNMLLTRISFYRKDKPILRIPLTYAVGTMPSNNVLGKSLVTAPLAGGVATDNSIAVALFNPNTLGVNAQEPMSVMLQPYEVDFPCDKITLDVLGWANINPDQSRFILIAVAP